MGSTGSPSTPVGDLSAVSAVTGLTVRNLPGRSTTEFVGAEAYFSRRRSGAQTLADERWQAVRADADGLPAVSRQVADSVAPFVSEQLKPVQLTLSQLLRTNYFARAGRVFVLSSQPKLTFRLV